MLQLKLGGGVHTILLTEKSEISQQKKSIVLNITEGSKACGNLPIP